MTLAVDMKTLSKIQKLLALSRDGGANEHEAALALDKAQELMRDNNLSAAMLEAQGVQSDDERRKNRMTGRAMFAWQRTLMEAVAASNYCLCSLVFNRNYDKVTDSAAKGYELIGRLSNVTAAQNMFDYLLQTARRLTVAAAVEEFGSWGAASQKWVNSYRHGLADRLSIRLRYRLAEAKKAEEAASREEATRRAHPGYAPSSNLPAVILHDWRQKEQDENNDVKRGWPIGTTTAQRLESERQSAEWSREWNLKYEAKQARVAELKALHPGLPDDVIGYMADGFTQQRSVDLARTDAERHARLHEPAKPETDAQRAKREAKEKRQEAAADARHARQNNKFDGYAYAIGHDAGRSVGLDTQVLHTEKKRLT